MMRKYVFNAMCMLLAMFYAGAVKGENASVDPKLKADVIAAIKLFETEGPEEYELIELWQESNASYIKALTAPVENVDIYLDPEIQRIMVGVYLMDMNYAQTFGRYGDAKKFAAALDILLGKLGFRNKELQQCCQEIMESAEREDQAALYRKLDDVVDRIWEDYVDKEYGLDLAIDGIYGWLIEGLYLGCEITAQQDYDAVFLGYLNEQMSYLRSMERTLNVFEDDSAMAGLVEKSERLQVVEEVLGQMSADRDIGPRDVAEMRMLITHARNEIID